MSLKEIVRRGLPKEGRTIPELCRQFKVDNEFKMMRIIAELENSGEATIDDFHKIYREDGGAIYLAKYKKTSG